MLFFGAASLAALVTLGALAYTGAIGSTPEYGSPQEAATAALRNETGRRCFVMANRLIPSLDENPTAQSALALRGRQPGWVLDDWLYAGGEAALAEELGGEIVASSADERWILIGQDTEAAIIGFVRVGNSKAGVVWAKATTSVAVPDERCE